MDLKVHSLKVDAHNAYNFSGLVHWFLFWLQVYFYLVK